MVIEPNVLALWFSHNKRVDDIQKNDCKLIYYPNDSDNSCKEKIMISMVAKVWKTILKSIEAAIRCTSHSSPPAVDH